MAKNVKAKFIEPMLLLRTDALPNDREGWQYELKVDGYRAIAFKTGGKLHLRSRNNNDFTKRYPSVLRGLARLPNETVIDGEIVRRWPTDLRCQNAQWLHASRASAVDEEIRALETKECPFANLPEKKSGRWGAGLTAAKMKDCRWLKPVLVGQFEFLEWTGDNHLRHSKFIALREDKSARAVKRE